MISPSEVVGRLQDQRSLSASTLVEFGHGATPIAYAQPPRFTGDKQYIGIEAWTRDPQHRQLNILRLIHERFNGQEQNIHFFTNHHTGRLVTSIAGKNPELWRTVGDNNGQLRANIASEVYASDVLSDPMVAHDPFRSLDILKQMGRIVQRSGLVVVRETYSPEVWMPSRQQEEAHIAQAGLQRVAQIQPRNTTTWDAMEKLHAPVSLSNKSPHPSFNSRYDIYQPRPV